MPEALAGIRVLDLSRVLTGPYCTMMLGDLGAEIIKVENPGTGDDTRQWGPPFVNGESTYFLSINRNKQSITLNLKHPEGREIFSRLVRESDVLIENFRPGTMDKLGLGYEKLQGLNPGLVYCSISGFGLTGPYGDKPGYDIVAQAMGGLMGTTGFEDGAPVKAGFSLADIGAGMFAAVAILAALRERDRSGLGQLVETSLFEGMIAWHTYLATGYFATGKVPRRLGSAHSTIVPYQAVQAADGYMVVAVGNEALWGKFCDALGLAEMKDDPRFVNNQARLRNREACIAGIEARLKEAPVAQWIAALDEAGVPAGPIYNIGQVYADPQTIARGMAVTLEHPVAGPVTMAGTPMRLHRTPAQMRQAPPTLGQHTDDILGRLGYTPEQVAALRQSGAL